MLRVEREHPNVFASEFEFEYDASDPDGYRAGVSNVSRLAGGRANHVKLFEIPVGQSICPYHYELCLCCSRVTVQLRLGSRWARMCCRARAALSRCGSASSDGVGFANGTDSVGMLAARVRAANDGLSMFGDKPPQNENGRPFERPSAG
jgi:hypothetical protein